MSRPRPDNQYAQAVLAFRYRFLTEALRQHGGNRVHTAKALGMGRADLLRTIRTLKIDVPSPGRGHPQRQLVPA